MATSLMLPLMAMSISASAPGAAIDTGPDPLQPIDCTSFHDTDLGKQVINADKVLGGITLDIHPYNKKMNDTAQAVLDDLFGVESATKLYDSLNDRWTRMKVAGATPHTFDGKGHLFVKWSGDVMSPKAELFDGYGASIDVVEPRANIQCQKFFWADDHVVNNGTHNQPQSRQCQICVGKISIQAEIPLNAVQLLADVVDHTISEGGEISVTDEAPYGARVPAQFMAALHHMVAIGLRDRNEEYRQWTSIGGFVGPRCRALQYLNNYHGQLGQLVGNKQPTEYLVELERTAVAAAQRVLQRTAPYFTPL